jgi:hypothetical protein
MDVVLARGWAGDTGRERAGEAFKACFKARPLAGLCIDELRATFLPGFAAIPIGIA